MAMGTGHALLNVVLPVMALLPTLFAQLFLMLAHVQTLLTGLAVAGFKLDVQVWFRRYAAVSMGPPLLFSSVVRRVFICKCLAFWFLVRGLSEYFVLLHVFCTGILCPAFFA